eukprot:TRINITY_DN16296_c0_g1_i4.p1 TRINITY_DN16296_c0_g1~~TRINITY_DN16296_c0_g1_i4.p1  ORF type:complete len:435 (+),score=38.70 TRINITY_DN16296_c0_g1_i4:68-1306(+)
MSLHASVLLPPPKLPLPPHRPAGGRPCTARRTLRPACPRRPQSARTPPRRQGALQADPPPPAAREWLQRTLKNGTAVVFFRSEQQCTTQGVLTSPRGRRFAGRSGVLRRPASARSPGSRSWVFAALDQAETLQSQRESAGYECGQWWPFRDKVEADGTAEAHAFVLREVPQDVALHRHHTLLALHSAQCLQKVCQNLAHSSVMQARQACFRALKGSTVTPMTLKSFLSNLDAVGASKPLCDDGSLHTATWASVYNAYNVVPGAVDALQFGRALTFAAGPQHRRAEGLLDMFLGVLRHQDKSCFLVELHSVADMYSRTIRSAAAEGHDWHGEPQDVVLPTAEAAVLAELRSLPLSCQTTGGEVMLNVLLSVIFRCCPCLAARVRGLPDLESVERNGNEEVVVSQASSSVGSVQ